MAKKTEVLVHERFGCGESHPPDRRDGGARRKTVLMADIKRAMGTIRAKDFFLNIFRKFSVLREPAGLQRLKVIC